MKKLLFSLMFAGVSAVSLNAQVWDIADLTKFPNSTIAIGTPNDGLKFAGASDFVVTANNATIGDFSATRRFQFSGNSYSGSTSPAVGTTQLPQTSKKWVEVVVPNSYILRIWARGGSTNRNILISDNLGTVLSSNPTFDSTPAAANVVISYKYTGSAPNLIISTGVGDNYIYKIEVVADPTMAVNDVKSGLKANAFSSGSKIYISNLESKNTDVKVYTANGSLVKSFTTSVDANFEINSKGLYFVNLKSEMGEKSVKVLLK